MPRYMAKDKVGVYLTVPKKMYSVLKVYCSLQDISMSDFMVDAISKITTTNLEESFDKLSSGMNAHPETRA